MYESIYEQTITLSSKDIHVSKSDEYALSSKGIMVKYVEGANTTTIYRRRISVNNGALRGEVAG
jgi:hypothetical protein